MNTRKKNKCGLHIGAVLTGIALALSGAGDSRLCSFAAEVDTEGKDVIVYTGPIFTGDEELFYPEEILEQDGNTYRLVSAEIKPVTQKGTLTYVSTRVPYELEGRQEAPETAVILLKDETSGAEYERELRRMEVSENACIWEDGFSFPVTVAGYDSDAFWLGETEIPADSDLSFYGAEFLAYLGLPKDCYRVESVEWDGESYEQDGIICRDALAKGEKLIRQVEVTYGGQVRTPETEAKQYTAVYEAVYAEETEETKEREAMAATDSEVSREPAALPVPPEQTILEKLHQWIREHLTVVTISAAFAVMIVGAMILLWLSARKERKSRED